jgi:hypothetical protein
MISWRNLLDLRPPVIYKLEHLDIVIEEKILLLITWQFKRRYPLSIQGHKKKYRQKEEAVIVKLPAQLEQVKIIIGAGWRKRKVILHLKKVKLDEETRQYIIQQFKPFSMPDINLPEIKLREWERPLIPKIRWRKKTVGKPYRIQPKIKIDKITYPH